MPYPRNTPSKSPLVCPAAKRLEKFAVYEKIKNTNYPNIDEVELLSQKNESFGVETFFKSLLESLKNKNTFTISDISQIFNDSK